MYIVLVWLGVFVSSFVSEFVFCVFCSFFLVEFVVVGFAAPFLFILFGAFVARLFFVFWSCSLIFLSGFDEFCLVWTILSVDWFCW